MTEQLNLILRYFGASSASLLIFGIAVGVLLIFFSVVSAARDRNPAAERMAKSVSRAQARRDRGILRAPDLDPKGIMRSFIPTDRAKRGKLQKKLARAGFPQPSAMRKFVLVRVVLGLLLPGLFLLVIFVSKVPGATIPLGATISKLTNLQVFQVLSVLVALGYYVPLSWLNGRMSERKQRVEESFPNALDLMQISVEAGLGFDAAMTRVGNELATVSPDVAFEFLTVQRQVSAGRDRGDAMRDMATRTGVEVVTSFTNVVQQSMHFGTSMGDALTTYSNEMRDFREMRAQEMANKLPVKMSAVLASLMLPALILLTVGPVIIRYARYFAAN